MTMSYEIFVTWILNTNQASKNVTSLMYTYHHLAQRFCEVIRQSNGVAVPDQLQSVFELFAVEVMWLSFRQMGRLPAEARPRPVGLVADSNKVCEVCNWEGKTLQAKYPHLACQRLERFCQAGK